MGTFTIKGRKAISGTHRVPGNKTAALPMVAAALLTSEPVVLTNMPDIADVRNMLVCAKAFGAKYYNREDDAGEKGLRTSKMQYHPLRLEPECFFIVRNELTHLQAVPTVRTPHLTLTPIRKEDAEKYYLLTTDEKRNEYWGYDYKKDFPGEQPHDVFYKAAKRDFRERIGLNFAIRLNGEFIGETVLFEFNGRGECKLGVRIFSAFDGHGYGKEAFEYSMDFALYYLGIRRLLSSCYKQNVPSVKMHEKLMRKIGEDAEKFYYAREY